MEKICVAVRVRPAVAVSEDTINGNYWKIEFDNQISLRKSDHTPLSGFSYAFDHVFDESCTNEKVYELLTKDIIHAAVEGFNGTVFAYGQTSSGKTFTMNGCENDLGIIQRSVKDIFNRIDLMCDREFLIRVSYMEIYNEEINDLFAVENQKLQIHESLERGIFVAGLREEIVNNAEQVLNLMASGEVNRHFGETNMNARSSRSHTIFSMVIESKGKETDSSNDYACGDAIRVSVLNLVDLAGSERIAKTGAGGVRLKEGKHINKSLMALGNVINKLSDGSKQRAHIPYRDSKLTRILQPALGGNAKTSIICTVAPEEIHIEETKGTLQFASRAKRITNCAQVNEILTDAALLKRQKLEIEELRRKLQGSRAEVLEQEILKLRNDMLKYELEREKLEMQLDEERKSHKERDRCIREQQMKIDNLSSLCDKDSAEGQKNSERQSRRDELNDSNSRSQGDIFKTPSFKGGPNAFVAKRSNYSRLPDFSPLPNTLGNVADEDTWMKMNKGYVADLDLIQMTPLRKTQSFPSSETTPEIPSDYYRKEVDNLKRQLALVTAEKNALEKKYSEQVSLNDHLMEEMSGLKQEALTIREAPQTLCKSLTSYKDIYKNSLLKLQNLVPDGGSCTAKLLSSTTEFGITLFANLESYFLSGKDHRKFFPNDSLVQEQCKLLSERLKDMIESMVASEKLALQSKEVLNTTWGCDSKDSTMGGETAASEEHLSTELENIKTSYHNLEKKLELQNHLLEDSEEKYTNLEKNYKVLKEERDSLLDTLSESSQKLTMVTAEKQHLLENLRTEAQKRKYLQEEIKQFSVAFDNRQRSFMSFQSEFKSKIEKLRATVPVSKPLGC